jgi:septum formation protein
MPPVPELILASASSGRADVLRGAAVTFRQVPASVDERALEARMLQQAESIDGARLATALAIEKAAAVSRLHPKAIVIGADQVMECDGVIFHKPADRAAARIQLQQLRGRTHRLHSGIAIARGGEAQWRHVDQARLTMRPFSDAFLDSYIESEAETLLASVGSYRIEGRGIQLFSQVEGSHFTIIGLPLLPLLGYLRNSGWLTK